MGLDALAKWILDHLLLFSPIWWVDQYRLGMRVRRGKIKGPVRSGRIVWRIPLIDKIESWPSTAIPISLSAGAVTTSDGYSIAVSGNLRYLVIDIVKAWTTFWHFESSVTQASLGLICSYAASEKWRTLRSNRRGLEEALLAELNAFFEPNGIRILNINLTDLVRTTARRHYHEGVPPPPAKQVAQTEEE